MRRLLTFLRAGRSGTRDLDWIGRAEVDEFEMRVEMRLGFQVAAAAGGIARDYSEYDVARLDIEVRYAMLVQELDRRYELIYAFP